MNGRSHGNQHLIRMDPITTRRCRPQPGFTSKTGKVVITLFAGCHATESGRSRVKTDTAYITSQPKVTVLMATNRPGLGFQSLVVTVTREVIPHGGHLPEQAAIRLQFRAHLLGNEHTQRQLNWSARRGRLVITQGGLSEGCPSSSHHTGHTLTHTADDPTQVAPSTPVLTSLQSAMQVLSVGTQAHDTRFILGFCALRLTACSDRKCFS